MSNPKPLLKSSIAGVPFCSDLRKELTAATPTSEPGHQNAAVYDEQIIARSCTRVQPQPFLWFPASFLSKIAAPRSQPLADFPNNKASRQFDDLSAVYRRHIAARIGTEVADREKKSRRFRRLLKLITGRRQTE